MEVKAKFEHDHNSAVSLVNVFGNMRNSATLACRGFGLLVPHEARDIGMGNDPTELLYIGNRAYMENVHEDYALLHSAKLRAKNSSNS